MDCRRRQPGSLDDETNNRHLVLCLRYRGFWSDSVVSVLGLLRTMKLEDAKKGLRVRVCAEPKCGHSGGITGTIDLVGKFTDTSEPETIMAAVMRDGGGCCGPFRLEELTPE